MVQRELTTLGSSANMDTFVRQRVELEQAPGPHPNLETNKQTNNTFFTIENYSADTWVRKTINLRLKFREFWSFQKPYLAKNTLKL